jgi:hypothetical protein
MLRSLESMPELGLLHQGSFIRGRTSLMVQYWRVFTVTLSQPLTGVVKLSYATSNGTAAAGADYLTATGVVTFNAGVTSRPITVAVVGDRIPEPDEIFTVTLTGVAQGPAVIGQASSLGTITNND